MEKTKVSIMMPVCVTILTVLLAGCAIFFFVWPELVKEARALVSVEAPMLDPCTVEELKAADLYPEVMKKHRKWKEQADKDGLAARKDQDKLMASSLIIDMGEKFGLLTKKNWEMKDLRASQEGGGCQLKLIAKKGRWRYVPEISYWYHAAQALVYAVSDAKDFASFIREPFDSNLFYSSAADATKRFRELAWNLVLSEEKLQRIYPVLDNLKDLPAGTVNRLKNWLRVEDGLWTATSYDWGPELEKKMEKDKTLGNEFDRLVFRLWRATGKGKQGSRMLKVWRFYLWKIADLIGDPLAAARKSRVKGELGEEVWYGARLLGDEEE